MIVNSPYPLVYGTPDSAAVDLQYHSMGEWSGILEPKSFALIPTGVKVAFKPGYCGLVFIRSGLSTKGISLTNGVGLIDNDYRGEIFVSVQNLSDTTYQFVHGDRVAQLLMTEYSQMPFKYVSDDEWQDRIEREENFRRDGGFGSTGR